MKKNYVIYLIIPLLLLITGITLISCGGGEDGYVNPGLQGNTSNQLISKEVSGYIYHTASPSSSETGEITEKFIILNSPARGDESFLSQLWGYFEETSPDSLNTQEMQNLHSRLSVEMENYVPLPEWNPSAQLYTIYQDSKSSAPISVDGNGYFSSTVLVSPGDDNVSFEVILGEDACYPVEAIASSDMASSSEEGTELKSCPEIILTFPGWCEIFAVYGNPSVNLRDAGLTFTLNDPSMGWVTEPFYVKCNGVRNYNVAYGIYISSGNLETPVSSTITAQTATGLTLNIFTEVVKSCGSISGHVGGAGVVPYCGFVYSLGFDAFSCIDEAGNYQLDKVFKGHFRKVLAVYWVQVNGQLVRHREERTIDFFNGDLTGFDLPEGVQPTPTPRLPDDPFYDQKVSVVLYFFDQWEEEYGREVAAQRIIAWINGTLPSSPPIPEGMSKAYPDEYDDSTIVIEFQDGMWVGIGTKPESIDEEITDSQNYLEEEQNNDIYLKTPFPIVSSNITTFSPEKILILYPTRWEWYSDYYPVSVYNDIVWLLRSNDFYKDKYKAVVTNLEDFYFDFGNPVTDPNYAGGAVVDSNTPLIRCYQYPGKSDNIVTPQDFESTKDYGFIYIHTHGCHGGSIDGGLVMQNNKNIIDWLRLHPFHNVPVSQRIWRPNYETKNNIADYDPNSPYESVFLKHIHLYGRFFGNLNSAGAYKDSIVYLSACNSWDAQRFFSNAQIFLGNNSNVGRGWHIPIGYYFFLYMMYGPIYEPSYVPGYDPNDVSSNPPDPNEPMHAYEALETLTNYYKVNPDPKLNSLNVHCELKIYPPDPNNIYFPAPATIVIGK